MLSNLEFFGIAVLLIVGMLLVAVESGFMAKHKKLTLTLTIGLFASAAVAFFLSDETEFSPVSFANNGASQGGDGGDESATAVVVPNPGGGGLMLDMSGNGVKIPPLSIPGELRNAAKIKLQVAVLMEANENEDMKVDNTPPGHEIEDCEFCPELIVMPAGDFPMGATRGDTLATQEEGPRKMVTIPEDYAIGRFEITIAQYLFFVMAADYKPSDACAIDGKLTPDTNFISAGIPQTVDNPVVCISWKDADAYAKWLAMVTRKPYRLPTSAEWELAARAGSVGRWYTQLPLTEKDAHFTTTTRPAGTIKVGSFPSNSYRLADVHGNAEEWVADCWSDTLRDVPADGKPWLGIDVGIPCDMHVSRGGAWYDTIDGTRVSVRRKRQNDRADYGVGFRVARDLIREPQISEQTSDDQAINQSALVVE